MFEKAEVEIVKADVYDVITTSDFAEWEKTGDDPAGGGKLTDWIKQLF